MKKSKKLQHPTQSKSRFIKTFSYFLYTLSALCFVVAFYNLYFSSRILPGVYLNNINYSGLTFEEALDKIDKQVPEDKAITLKVSGDSFLINTNDIELSYSKAETLEKLKSAGRESVFSHLTYMMGFFKPLSVNSYVVYYNKELLNVYLASFAAQNYPKNQNAYFYLENDEIKIKDADFGKNIDLEKLSSQIDTGLSQGVLSYSVPARDFKPSIFASDLTNLKPVVEGLSKNYFAFKYENYEFFPTSEQVIKLFTPKNVEGKVVLVVDEGFLDNYVSEISTKVNIQPKALVFEERGGEIIFEPPITGLEVNIDQTVKNAVLQLDQVLEKNSADKTTIEIAVKATKPDTKSNEYGITELIAEGESWFVGSISSRVSNIKTASDKVKGTLVAPGKEFSFNKAVGPIDKEHGFNDAYVISKGRTVLGNGGGVCQVSTTIYRAALNSGLPITERNAHAYRVGYYEQKTDVGLDATIYQPGVDFRFKNDTQNYILVYTVFDQAKSHLTVKIYGTGDGRTVSITKPKMLTQIAPPETIYEDTDQLPKGAVEQVEWPAWGGTVEYSRIVKSADGKVMYEDKFKSYYTPWPAVFRRGV